MADFLPRCLESLVRADRAEQWLEAIVVNDGSKDDSLQVAKLWQQRYPNIITVIDKPNGNYGSTINAALPVVQGMWVKILDSDDSFDTSALNHVLSTLDEASRQDFPVDVVDTHFVQLYAGGKHEVVRYNSMGKEPFEYGRVYPLDEVMGSGYVRSFFMHQLTYRTELLRTMRYRQTEGISYTDTEWACFPMYHARTIMFLNQTLYLYNMDREGQTMDPKVIVKSLPQIEKVNDSLLAYYEAHKEGLSAERAEFMRKYHEHRLRLFYKLFLLDMPREMFEADRLAAVDAKYAAVCDRNDFRVNLYPENKLLRIDYVAYWRKHQQRWPKWLETVNHWIDIVVKWLYVRIFRR